MDHAQGRITVLYVSYNYSDCKKVVYLIKCLVLCYHLFIDAEQVLYSAVDLGIDVCVFDMVADFFCYFLDKVLLFFEFFRYVFGEFFICDRLYVLQRKVIEFYLDF